MVDLDAAYAHCARLARAHYENFPVASWLVPRDARHHVAAVYAFARGADDLADEGSAPAPARLDALERWRTWLHRAADGLPVDEAGPDAPVFVALAASARQRQLPLWLFDDLVSAFAQDVRVSRYATWADVLDYCRRSANPVGRLVLRIVGVADPRADEASDAVCTALQLTNFWQDLARDWAAGRLYVPEEEWKGAGARLEEFDPAALTPAWRAALARSAGRTRGLFDEGRRVCDLVRGRVGYELRLTWLGGMRVLERLGEVEFDTVHRRPTLGANDLPLLLWRAATWRAQTSAREEREA